MKGIWMSAVWALVLLVTSERAHAFYNPTTGRWLNRDPIGEDDSHNQYALANNAAIQRIDYLGLTICSVIVFGDAQGCSAAFSTRTKSKQKPKPEAPKPEHPGGGQCPNNVPTVNGCGTGGWKGKLVRDAIWADFSGPCNVHDRCYGTCGSNKMKCDIDFWNDMRRQCREILSNWESIEPPPVEVQIKYQACLESARVYAAAVFKYGQGAYEEAQREGCKCHCSKAKANHGK